MVKKSLAVLSYLVSILACFPVQAQTLTLDELIKISKVTFINADAYLSGKGWQLSVLPASANNDSTFKAAWSIDVHNAKYEPQQISNVLLIWKKSSSLVFPILVYRTRSRHSFDAIKARVLSYNMEEQGGFTDSTGIGSVYYGATYEAVLHVSPSTVDDPLCYAAQIQLHGLTKVYIETEDGTLKPKWRKLIMYGWKAFKNEGAVIRAQPNDTSKVLEQVVKGDLVIIPKGWAQDCPECGDNYYKAWLPADEKHQDKFDTMISPGVLSSGYYGYVLKSELHYQRLSSE